MTDAFYFLVFFFLAYWLEMARRDHRASRSEDHLLGLLAMELEKEKFAVWKKINIFHFEKMKKQSQKMGAPAKGPFKPGVLVPFPGKDEEDGDNA